MITEHEIFLTDPSEKAKVIEFLKGFDLTFTGNIDYTMGLYDDGQLIGTGSLGGRVMRDIAISEKYQKKGLTRRIIRNLQGESYRRGVTGNQIFTKPYFKIFFVKKTISIFLFFNAEKIRSLIKLNTTSRNYYTLSNFIIFTRK